MKKLVPYWIILLAIFLFIPSAFADSPSPTLPRQVKKVIPRAIPPSRRSLPPKNAQSTKSHQQQTAKSSSSVSTSISRKKAKKNIIIRGFEVFVTYLDHIVFYKFFGFPFVVIVLVLGSIFFTFRMGFINLFGFSHSLEIIRGKYDNPEDAGEISHFQALTSALSATVGLGNIAGVAVAVGKGGPGAVFWMLVIAFFGMTAKFVECTLAQLWRKIDDDGTVHGGPMYYLSQGLATKGWGTLGKGMSIFFAICIIGGAFGGGNMFQANQSYELVSSTYFPQAIAVFWGINLNALLFGIVLAFLVGLVILGGIKRIGAATSKIVPFMVTLYVGTSLFIIFTNFTEIPRVLHDIIAQAFNADAVFGGVIGVIVQGVSRAAFSNEAGIGSAAIAHSAAKTDEPVREGMVAMIGPFIDTIVICLMTALVILITAPKNQALHEMRSAQKQVYVTQKRLQSLSEKAPERVLLAKKLKSLQKIYKAKQKGTQITGSAFSSVISWFPYLLSIIVFLFAYSTMISWSYYGEKGWIYLFGGSSINVYRLLFLAFVILGSVTKLTYVLTFSDAMIFLAAFPNIIGAVVLSDVVRKRLDDYWSRYKNGEFKTYS